MSKVQLTPLAQKDLKDIKNYIQNDLKNPQAAASVVARITKQLRALAGHPELGTALDSGADEESCYRFLVCGNYLAFYRTVDDIAIVDRIIYGRRDYIRILFEKLPEDSD